MTLRINEARSQADRYMKTHAPAPTPGRRVPKDQRLMLRYPVRRGELILAGDEETLREKLAKKMQARARKAARVH